MSTLAPVSDMLQSVGIRNKETLKYLLETYGDEPHWKLKQNLDNGFVRKLAGIGSATEAKLKRMLKSVTIPPEGKLPDPVPPVDKVEPLVPNPAPPQKAEAQYAGVPGYVLELAAASALIHQSALMITEAVGTLKKIADRQWEAWEAAQKQTPKEPPRKMEESVPDAGGYGDNPWDDAQPVEGVTEVPLDVWLSPNDGVPGWDQVPDAPEQTEKRRELWKLADMESWDRDAVRLMCSVIGKKQNPMCLNHGTWEAIFANLDNEDARMYWHNELHKRRGNQ